MIVALLAAFQLASAPMAAAPSLHPTIASSTAEAAKLDPIARSFVSLALEVENYDPGYVDAYTGPDEWQAAAKAKPRTADQLKTEAARLMAAASAVDASKLDPVEKKRRLYLIGQSRAAATRLNLRAGVNLSFQDEAEAIFGVRPPLYPLSSYDATLAKIEALAPGTGPLPDRVDAFYNRYLVAADKLQPVMKAAIAECRRRTLEHIALPANEKFDLEIVTGKPWSGYNWYKGDAHSLIQVNTDLPVRIGRAVDLGCHEGYPGHHVLNVLSEQNLLHKRGWVEFYVNPLFGPRSLIDEGSANYGIELAFPGGDQLAFEKAVLYPLAGLDPKTADAYDAMRKATAALVGAENTIADDYLAHRIDKATAVAELQKYQIRSLKSAEQTVSFIDTYRSYIINYGVGLDMVRAHVEKAGGQDARWTAMQTLISEPGVPSELK